MNMKIVLPATKHYCLDQCFRHWSHRRADEVRKTWNVARLNASDSWLDFTSCNTRQIFDWHVIFSDCCYIERKMIVGYRRIKLSCLYVI